MPIFDQQTSILSKLRYYLDETNQQDAPFFNYHEKMTALMPILCQKNFNSLKKTLLSCPYFVKKRLFSQKHSDPMSFFYLKKIDLMPIFYQKMYILFKTLRSHVFFEVFIKNNNTFQRPNLVKRTLIQSKQYYLMDQKKQKNALFSDFARKSLCFHFWLKKRPFSKNTMHSCPYFFKKTSILSKSLCSHVIFQFFHGNLHM